MERVGSADPETSRFRIREISLAPAVPVPAAVVAEVAAAEPAAMVGVAAVAAAFRHMRREALQERRLQRLRFHGKACDEPLF